VQVVIYLKQTLNCLKAEEGLTGRLKSPRGGFYNEAPEDERIGGYPTSLSDAEALDLDSEGRAVVVELEYFVFISVYCPAVTITERELFRAKFLSVLEERIQNLLALGKRVIVAGDVNICRAPIDTADPIGAARRTETGIFEDTNSRRWLQQMLSPEGPLIDTCRHFHPDREGMFTCISHAIIMIDSRLGNTNSSKSWQLRFPPYNPPVVTVV
jgi:AP endonuclease-2